MFSRRRGMRNWGGWGYGYGRPWRHWRHYRRGCGCFPGCCLGLVLPVLLLGGLFAIAAVHYL